MTFYFYVSVVLALSVFGVYAKDWSECRAITVAMVHDFVESSYTENVFLVSKITGELVHFRFVDNYMSDRAIRMSGYRVFRPIV